MIWDVRESWSVGELFSVWSLVAIYLYRVITLILPVSYPQYQTAGKFAIRVKLPPPPTIPHTHALIVPHAHSNPD